MTIVLPVDFQGRLNIDNLKGETELSGDIVQRSVIVPGRADTIAYYVFPPGSTENSVSDFAAAPQPGDDTVTLKTKGKSIRVSLGTSRKAARLHPGNHRLSSNCVLM